MRLTLILAFGLTVSGNLFSQVEQKQVTTVKSEESFEQYCLKNALSTIQVAPEKSNVKLNGELKGVNKVNPTYLDYGIVLLENEAQYFSIEGKNTIIKVESLYRLRLGYNAKK